MRILVINQHTNNFGDDLAGVTLIQNLLRLKKLKRIDLIYNTSGKLPIKNRIVKHNRDITLRTIGLVSLLNYFVFGKKCKTRNSLLARLIDIVNKSDYIFVSPCGANIGVYKDWGFLLRILLVIRAGRKPIFYLNTIGKSNSLIFNFIAKRALKKSTIYVREKASADYLDSMGIPAKVGVDTAFSFKPEKKSIKKSNKLVYVPTPLTWHPDFREDSVGMIDYAAISKHVATFAKSNGLEVALVPHLKSDEEQKLYKKVQEVIRSFGVKCDILNANDVFEYYCNIADARYVVSMRYHPLIIAAKNQIPFVALSYENKMHEVCRYCHVENANLDLREYTDKKMDYKLKAMVATENEFCKELSELSPNLNRLTTIPLEEIKDGITFVIVTWNNADVITKCLDSLYRFCEDPKVIVVDNASSDSTVKKIESKGYKDCTVILSKKNLGFAKANNLALKKVKTDFVCFLNPDTILLEDIVKPSVEILEKDPRIGLVSCKLLNKDKTLQASTFNFLTAKEVFSAKYKLPKILPNFIKEKSFPNYSKSKKNKFVDWTIGAEMIMRTEDAKKIEGFSEEYYMYTEDMDFCRKLLNLGKKVFYLADVSLIHIGGVSEATNTNYDKMRMIIRNELLFAKKFYGTKEFEKVYRKNLRAYRVRRIFARLNVFAGKNWREHYNAKMTKGIKFCNDEYSEMIGARR